MPYSPPGKRGDLYSTHLWARCYEYHPCKRCLQCNHFNPHNPLCTVCESRKPGHGECRCSDAMQYAIIRLEEITGQPMYNPNPILSNVTVDRGSMCFSSEQSTLIPQLEAKEF